jgi:hypothetical protein
MKNLQASRIHDDNDRISCIDEIPDDIDERAGRANQNDIRQPPRYYLGSLKVGLATSTALIIFQCSNFSLRWSVASSASSIRTLEKKDKPLCTRSQIRVGRWVAATYDRLPYPHLNSPNGSSSSSSSSETYDWKVRDEEECQFTEWSNDEFCALTANQTLLFVGDSLMREQYTDVVRRFGVNTTMNEMFHGDDRPALCQEGSTHTYLRFRLERAPNNPKRMMSNWNFDGAVIVVNEGIHYLPDDQFIAFLDRLLSWLNHWQDTAPACQAQDKSGKSSCLAIWKTSVPGHPNCWNFTQPTTNVTEMEALVANSALYTSTDEYEKHGWWARTESPSKSLPKAI